MSFVAFPVCLHVRKHLYCVHLNCSMKEFDIVNDIGMWMQHSDLAVTLIVRSRSREF